MTKRNFNISLIILGILIVLSGFMIVNLAISLKYETTDNFVSKISGENLQLTQKIWQALNLLFAAIVICMLIFRKKILNIRK